MSPGFSPAIIVRIEGDTYTSSVPQGHRHHRKVSHQTRQPPINLVMASLSSSSLRSFSAGRRCLPLSPRAASPPLLPSRSPPKRLAFSVALGGRLSLTGPRSRSLVPRARSSMAGAATESGRKKVVEVFDTEEDLAVSLAKYTADLSAKFAEERGAFSVVVSGGSLIKSLRFGA